MAGDLAGPVLQDQIEALNAACAAHPDLDPGRVAIRGWSFGGYLAALAVLRRPDVFTRPSRVPRSPTGTCTTPTTPSAT